jgi:two-component system, chemotaxis family, chemotaxis protein CheY
MADEQRTSQDQQLTTSGPVLLIDDDEDVRDVLAIYLRRAGIPTIVAPDGVAGIALLRDGVRPSAIIVDLMMPGMNGIAFRAEQRANPEWAAIPLIIFSGADEAAETAERVGAAAFLMKPAEPRVLVELIQRFYAPSQDDQAKGSTE